MASSGTFTLVAKSVDYTGAYASGTCYTAANASGFGRGAATCNIVLNYTINDSGLLTVSYNSATGGAWCVCSQNGYQIDIDFSTDNVNWTNIMHSFANDWPSCPENCTASASDEVKHIAQSLCAGLTPVVLTQNGYIRARMWTLRACPTDILPNAFPNDAASAATAVSIHVDVNYRPGAVRVSNSWKSTNRSGGKCQIRSSGSWSTMTTTNGGTGTGNPPSIRKNNGWVNQSLTGGQS